MKKKDAQCNLVVIAGFVVWLGATALAAHLDCLTLAGIIWTSPILGIVIGSIYLNICVAIWGDDE